MEWDGFTSNANYLYTLSFGFQLGGGFGTFIESYGFIPEYGPADHRLDGGFTWAMKPNFQLDISSGIGLSEVSPDGFLSFGVSWRLPK
jgi:hypothetical protein